MAKNLSEFKYLTFDVVGTLIDFEGGLKASLTEIGKSAGVEVDGEVIVDLDQAPDGDIGPVVPPPSTPFTKGDPAGLPQSRSRR